MSAESRKMTGPEANCPFCKSADTELFSLFGQNLLTSQFYCRSCRTVFEAVKWGRAEASAVRDGSDPVAGQGQK